MLFRKELVSSSLLLLLLPHDYSVVDAKCGDWAHEECIGNDDPRYDPAVSADLKDIHPIYGKIGGYYQCEVIVLDETSSLQQAEYVDDDDDEDLPYDLASGAQAYINVTVEGTRFFTHQIVIYSPASDEFCDNTPSGQGNTLDDGICGINGYAQGGDIYRTSTHDKNEYSIPVKSSGLFTKQEDHSSEDNNEEEEEEHDHVGGGVEHPIHDVDNALFAEDSTGNTLVFSVKTFDPSFNSYESRSGQMDLLTGKEITTSKYSCTRSSSETDWRNAMEESFDAAQVTEATRTSLDMEENGGCFVPPCITEDELCTQDPSCSISPYQEKSTLKPVVIIGFSLLGLFVICTAMYCLYEQRIKRIRGEAKQKFATRLQSTFVGSNFSDSPTKLLEMFDYIDERGEKDGMISRDELWNYVTTSNDTKAMTEKEFNVLFKAIDTDNSGEIDFTEFVAFVGEMKDMSSNPRQEAALNHDDEDDDDEHTDWT